MKKVNTGAMFYFIDFEARFFRTNLFLAGTWQKCFKTLI